MNRLITLAISLAVISCGTAFSQNLLTNGDFSDGLNGWNTFVDAGSAPTFGVVGNSARITKATNASEDWSTGVIYQIVNVAAGTHLKISGDWAGNLSGAGGMWWGEVAVFSLPTAYPLAANPQTTVNLNDQPNYFIPAGYDPSTAPANATYAGSQTTFLGACFDYPGNFANFSASGGTYAGGADFLNSFGSTTPTWSTQNLDGSLYDWQAAKAAMGADWSDLFRQAYNVTDIVSNGQVVVAIKFGSQYNDDGWIEFSNIVLEQVPEPSTIILLAAGASITATIRRRKNSAV